MDALTFMWVTFAILCIVVTIIAVAVENAVERKEELKRVKRENRKLKNEVNFLNLMVELNGGNYENAKKYENIWETKREN